METTLCYIEQRGKLLMLNRNKKTNDYNEGKWIGVGGKVENESIEACLLREVKEETGLTLKSYTKYGIVYFHQGDYHETMHLFYSNDFSGSLIESNEGDLAFIDQASIFTLNLWPGDVIFLKRILERAPFSALHLYYESDQLQNYHFE